MIRIIISIVLILMSCDSSYSEGALNKEYYRFSEIEWLQNFIPVSNILSTREKKKSIIDGCKVDTLITNSWKLKEKDPYIGSLVSNYNVKIVCSEKTLDSIYLKEFDDTVFFDLKRYENQLFEKTELEINDENGSVLDAYKTTFPDKVLGLDTIVYLVPGYGEFVELVNWHIDSTNKSIKFSDDAVDGYLIYLGQ